MRRRTGIVALAVLVASCGGDSGSTEATTSPPATSARSPATTPQVAEGSYESVRALQLDVEAAFYLCSAPMKVYDPPLVEGALAQADCSNAVTLLIFDPGQVQTGAAALQAEADDTLALLVGDNWIIACSPDQGACEQIQGTTGGELVVSSP